MSPPFDWTTAHIKHVVFTVVSNTGNRNRPTVYSYTSITLQQIKNSSQSVVYFVFPHSTAEYESNIKLG